MALHDTPVSPRQKQVLDLMIANHNGAMPATARNYKAVAAVIGWKNHGGVPECLYALRSKGLVKSVGASSARPDAWEVVR